MGVDAEIYFKTENSLTEQELKKLSFRLGDAFGTGIFWDEPLFIDYRNDYCNVEGTYHLKYTGRFYGPGYERGNLPEILALCQFLKDYLTGCTVYYCSDSGASTYEFTEQFKKEIWDHFIKHGRGPYLGWDNGHPCPKCNGPMWHQGYSNGKNMYTCSGCGYSDFKNQ